MQMPEPAILCLRPAQKAVQMPLHSCKCRCTEVLDPRLLFEARRSAVFQHRRQSGCVCTTCQTQHVCTRLLQGNSRNSSRCCRLLGPAGLQVRRLLHTR